MYACNPKFGSLGTAIQEIPETLRYADFVATEVLSPQLHMHSDSAMRKASLFLLACFWLASRAPNPAWGQSIQRGTSSGGRVARQRGPPPARHGLRVGASISSKRIGRH